jgi:hypothetical protein
MYDEIEGEGFSDMSMTVYALVELWSLHIGADGFPKEDIDAITEKYFGTTVQNFESQMTTVIPETGEVTATGWGGSSARYVLKDLQTDTDGIRTGEFYLFSFGMGEIPATTKEDLLQGHFDEYPQPSLATIVFEEKTDENGEMYLRYYDAIPQGEAEPPYTVYQGE